jgi:hypothetical protein
MAEDAGTRHIRAADQQARRAGSIEVLHAVERKLDVRGANLEGIVSFAIPGG